MPQDTPITDYTNRDYASLLASLLDLAALKLPEWTDRSENDLGRLLLELFAHTGDVLLYHQDRIANEAFLETAVERRSVIDHLSLIGYTLATPSPAAATLTVTAKYDASSPVVVDVGARFATEAAPGQPAVEFIYLPVSETPHQVDCDDSGKPEEVRFEITVLNAERVSERLGGSSGEANQAFRLTQQPVLLPRDGDSQDHFQVEVKAEGGFERWEKRSTLLYSQSGDPHFTVRVDAEDAAELLFGDGTYGRVPPRGAEVRATYLIGGGAAGNVGPDTITVVKPGVNVPVTIRQPYAASGGADRESIDHAKRLAPSVFRSLGRAVTASDYAALAQNVPGVARAVAVSAASQGAPPPAWNHVDLYVVAAGGTAPTDELRARLLRYFEPRRMMTTLVSVRAPVFVRVDLEVEIGVEPTFYRDDVRQRTHEALAALFEIERLEFGDSFYLSKVFEAAEAVRGVAFVRATCAGFRSQPPDEPVDPAAAAKGFIPLRPREFLQAGKITVETSGGLS